MKRSQPMKRGGRLKPKGKKGTAWDAVRAELKIKFEERGVTFCELRLPGRCWYDNALGFAHSLKRRNIVGDQIMEVCLSCNPCHDIIESKPEAEMAAIVRAIIAKRGWK